MVCPPQFQATTPVSRTTRITSKARASLTWGWESVPVKKVGRFSETIRDTVSPSATIGDILRPLPAFRATFAGVQVRLLATRGRRGQLKATHCVTAM